MTTCASCKNTMELSAGTMTADGMKCPNCVATVPPPDPALLRKAGAMPGTLKVLVGLMLLGIAIDLYTVSILGVAFSSALLAGILVGNDGVRRFMIGLAWLNLAYAVAVAGMAASAGVDSTVVIFASVFAIASAAFVIWCLGQENVRDWMFRTAFKDGL